MANSYVITSYASNGTTIVVGGTVNGVPVSIAFQASQSFANATAFENFIAPLMLAAVPTVYTSSSPLATSFSI